MTVSDSRDASWLDILVSLGPIVPLAFGAALAWWMRGQPLDYLVGLITILYGGSVLAFLTGVCRGIGARIDDRLALFPIVTTFVLFGLGFAAPVAAVMGQSVLALSVLVAGFAALAVPDSIAARSVKGPVCPAWLHPLRMLVAVASLGALLVLKLLSPY